MINDLNNDFDKWLVLLTDRDLRENTVDYDLSQYFVAYIGYTA